MPDGSMYIPMFPNNFFWQYFILKKCRLAVNPALIWLFFKFLFRCSDLWTRWIVASTDVFDNRWRERQTPTPSSGQNELQGKTSHRKRHEASRRRRNKTRRKKNVQNVNIWNLCLGARASTVDILFESQEGNKEELDLAQTRPGLTKRVALVDIPVHLILNRPRGSKKSSSIEKHIESKKLAVSRETKRSEKFLRNGPGYLSNGMD